MPGGDGTGPMGMGPMTGRAAGFCAGYSVPGYMNPIAGRGFGRRFGFGSGRGFRGGRGWDGYFGGMSYAAPYAPSSDQEADALKGQAEYLADALKSIKKRIDELEKSGENKK